MHPYPLSSLPLSPPTEPTPEARARKIFARWLARRQRGDEQPFEELIAEHSEVVLPLAALRRELEELDVLLARARDGGVALNGTLILRALKLPGTG